MAARSAIIVLGTFDSKGEEHRFLRDALRRRGLEAVTVNVGTGRPSAFTADIDLYDDLQNAGVLPAQDRDQAIAAMIARGRIVVADLYQKGAVGGIVSAGGGSGTHLCSRIMRVLPLGTAKVMVSTVASRDMSAVVGTRDITMMHSVVDLLGVNSISGVILDQAAAAVCAMAQSDWQASEQKRRVALSFFGFITPAAEAVREALEARGYEVIAFHANGTGGMALEELAAEGYFDGILDLATHELADALTGGYCGGIGPQRFTPVPGKSLPRLVVPGGMDCAVLEFTRDSVPKAYRDRPVFFYDFRSAVRLSADESRQLAAQLAGKLNLDTTHVKVLVPLGGWSVADCADGPLYAPDISRIFMETFCRELDPAIEMRQVENHINDPAFARTAADMMDRMIGNATGNTGNPRPVPIRPGSAEPPTASSG